MVIRGAGADLIHELEARDSKRVFLIQICLIIFLIRVVASLLPLSGSGFPSLFDLAAIAVAGRGVCGCPRFCKAISDVLAARRLYRSCVRPVRVAYGFPLAGTQFEERGPHRFRELRRSRPGTDFRVLNIEVLAA
jgi:hypothetical protein